MTVSTLPRHLDLRHHDAAGQDGATLQAFDSLLPGESFLLLAGADPRSLLDRLVFDRRGLFEWSPLEEGPEIWRVEVTRRNASPDSLRQVTEALGWDHDRLEAMEERAFAARGAGDLAEAKRLFAEFARGLRRHIGFEEQLLFPAFEEASGLPAHAGPTAVMRVEHRQIEALLEVIEAQIGVEGGLVLQSRTALHRVLGDHNVKEEEILYPSTDGLLGPIASDHLLGRIQAFRS
jgi:regulator of cell morphogenesis and NO signaling